ncbi:two-component system, OmpR family, sensor histidine kinase MtrB [Corynebacterium spheniscorum]|uniref:Sensor histidine kinase MtrB n=1 Tax=Corynebacterium spheniscorum TaxID=185761 RepID=A0A1I2Q1Y6_9CORY|nr:two-component system, OmpR family, sensor histidine kinase MtrB [Corynebacterium spheniscorum]
MIGSILLAAAVVMTILGIVMISVVTRRLVDTKLDIASSEIDRARVTVEQQIDATGSSNSLQVRLNSARAALSNRSTQSSEASAAAAVYEPVLLVPGHDDIETVTSPEGYRIPQRLQSFVSKGLVSYQFTTVDRVDGSSYHALVIGSPSDSDIPDLQVYLVLSMEQDEATLALMRGLLSAAGVTVVVLLVGIAWLATQQVIAPVRSASRIAQRLAAGHLRERMLVDGEDEMARLATSFNAMAESLSTKISQLEEYGDLQRQFTSDVSHELRTPLTTVRMAADLIAADPDALETSARRASELMIRELDRFEALLADLLEISRHDAGVADLAETRFDVRTAINAAWQQVEHLAVELHVPVFFDIAETPVYISGDARRVERILRNLLANAIDHSEGNPVEVRLAENSWAVGISVTDHGVGLKPGEEELAFNRFWRADASRVRHSGGTGLGLAIAREDALLHGGILDAIGNPGVGSQFRLILPKEPGETITEEPMMLAAPGPLEISEEVDEEGFPIHDIFQPPPGMSLAPPRIANPETEEKLLEVEKGRE